MVSGTLEFRLFVLLRQYAEGHGAEVACSGAAGYTEGQWGSNGAPMGELEKIIYAISCHFWVIYTEIYLNNRFKRSGALF